MGDVYAMRRANGDWFTLDDGDRRRVPVFHSSHDAFMARLRTVEMLLFSPIVLDARLLNEILDGLAEVDFCMVNNPYASLKRGTSLPHTQLASLIANATPRRRKWFRPSS